MKKGDEIARCPRAKSTLILVRWHTSSQVLRSPSTQTRRGALPLLPRRSGPLFPSGTKTSTCASASRLPTSARPGAWRSRGDGAGKLTTCGRSSAALRARRETHRSGGRGRDRRRPRPRGRRRRPRPPAALEGRDRAPTSASSRGSSRLRSRVRLHPTHAPPPQDPVNALLSFAY